MSLIFNAGLSKDFIFELMISVNCETQINVGSFNHFIDKSK
jgi:hypothetical protein